MLQEPAAIARETKKTGGRANLEYEGLEVAVTGASTLVKKSLTQASGQLHILLKNTTKITIRQYA